jgi:hypothetical protein
MSFEYPSNTPVVFPESSKATDEWNAWFSRAHMIVSSLQQSGTTADRPTSQLWIGRQYFDTDLGKPVFVKAVRPSVWVDGVGNVS